MSLEMSLLYYSLCMFSTQKQGSAQDAAVHRELCPPGANGRIRVSSGHNPSHSVILGNTGGLLALPAFCTNPLGLVVGNPAFSRGVETG